MQINYLTATDYIMTAPADSCCCWHTCTHHKQKITSNRQCS